MRFIYNRSCLALPRHPHSSLPVVFLSWLERERWQQFIMNLNKIADFNYFKEIYSDEFRPFDEVIIWRNVDRKVAQQ